MKICKISFLCHFYVFNKLIEQQIMENCDFIVIMFHFSDWLAVLSGILNDIISTINSMNILCFELSSRE